MTAAVGQACPGPVPVTRLRLARGVAWNALAAAAAQGGSFLSAIVVARVLGKEAFGQFAMIQNTVVTLSVIAGLGLGITATKLVSQYRSSDLEKLGRLLGLSSLVTWTTAVLFSIGMATAAPMVSGALAAPARIGTLYVLFITSNAFQAGALSGFEDFRGIARIGVIAGIVNVVLGWCFAHWWGLQGAVLSQGVAAFCLWSLYRATLREHCVIRYRHSWRERGVLFGFSIPASLCGMVAVAAAWWSNAILVRNAGFGELALFNAGNSMRSMVLFLPALVGRVASPILNHMKTNGDVAGYRRTFRTAIVANGLTAGFVATILALAGKRILAWFGGDFHGSSALVLLLMGSVVFEVLANNLFQTLFTEGKLWRNLGIVSVWTATLIALAAAGTARYGAAGLASAYLAAWSASAALYAWEARRL